MKLRTLSSRLLFRLTSPRRLGSLPNTRRRTALPPRADASAKGATLHKTAALKALIG
jgi:hypothetical protein